MRARSQLIFSGLVTGSALLGLTGCLPDGVSVSFEDAGSPTGTGGEVSGTGSGGAAETGGAPGDGTGGVGPSTGSGGVPNGTGGRTTTASGGRTGAQTGGRSGTGGAPGTGGRTNTNTGGAPSTGGRSGAAGAGTGGDTTPTGGTAGGDPGKVIFSGDFETGDLSQWAYVERCANDRILVYNTANMPAGAPAPRQGQYAARFHVLDTDVAPCTSTENPRAELETPESLFKPGDDRWEFWSMYVPSPMPSSLKSSGWFVIQEDYGAPWDGSPAIGWNLDLTAASKRFRMDRGEQYGHDQPGFADMALGNWVDFLVHKKFANTASGGGFVEVWINGVPMTFNVSGCANCTRLSTQTMHSTQNSLGFYLNTYRERGFFSSFDVYYDAVRIGTSRAAVELPR